MTSDERFEQDADMRLVELRRAELGLPKPPPPAWQTKIVVDLPFAPPPEPPQPRAGAVLSLAASATPSSGLIPGAVTTIGLSIVNEGGAPAHGAVIRLPLPGALAYRPGSLEIDGRPASDERAEALLGNGLALGELAPAQRVTLLLKLNVKAGLDDPRLSPSLASSDAAVVGARALRLERKRAAPTAFAATLAKAAAAEESPYELEAEEAIVYEAGEAAIAPIVPPKAAPARSIERRAPERRLATSLGKTKLASLAHFFSPTRSLGMVAHYLLLSALACSRTLPLETSRDEIASFFAAQDAFLTKVLVAKRLGKRIALDDVAAPFPPFPPEIPESGPLPETAPRGAVILVRSFSLGELEFIARAIANSAASPFTRVGQFSVLLCAKTVVASDPSQLDACERALADYATAAAAEINRLFVRARLDKRTDLFGASSPLLDARARAVVTALASLAA